MNVLRMIGRKMGGHVHVACFSGAVSQVRPVTLRGFGKCGDLTVTADEWEAWQTATVPTTNTNLSELREDPNAPGLLVLMTTATEGDTAEILERLLRDELRTEEL